MSAPAVQTGFAASLERQLESLSTRDRYLLSGLFGTFGLLFLFGIWWVLSGALSAMAGEVRDAKETLQRVYALQGEYQSAVEQSQAGEARLRSYTGRPVQAYLEQQIGEASLSEYWKGVTPTGTPEVSGGVREANYVLELQKVPSLDGLVRLLYQLETGDYPLKVGNATFKTSSSKSGTTYNLKLELVVYSLAEG